ncbi:MAG: MBOAT family protein, partial [Acidobacteriota bacterium]|nr:MBOAT family protein [Acidobacteriota bacterium]
HALSGPPRRFALNPEDVSLGFTWFLMGLAKKVLIADKLAPTADAAFAHPAGLTAANAWVGLIVYSMQLYFDFSGYSDMALGLARIFSIRFPLNFDSPYKATSITEYWQRWHMTLSRYITLYLYNPLLLSVQRRRIASGRKISRKALATFGGFASMVAYPTLLTMLLTGMWHGAGLQFIVFGLIHGVFLTASQAWRHFRQRARNPTPAPRAAGLRRLAMMSGVYLQVAFALIFFRSDSLPAAGMLLRNLFGAHGAGRPEELLPGALAFCLFPVVWFFPNTQQILGQESGAGRLASSPGTPNVNPAPAPTLFPGLRWSPTVPWAVIMAVLLFAVLANLDSSVRFLYFQF